MRNVLGDSGHTRVPLSSHAFSTKRTWSTADVAGAVYSWFASRHASAASRCEMITSIDVLVFLAPAASAVELPTEWAEFAEQPADPLEVDPAAIDEHRDEWLRDWSDLTSR